MVARCPRSDNRGDEGVGDAKMMGRATEFESLSLT